MARTAKLTIRLPQDELDFVRRYAAEHRLTLTDLVSRYFRRLQQPRNHGKAGIHPDVAAISGLLPANIDMRREHRQHQERRTR